MPSTYILYDDKHSQRARALSNATPGAFCSQISDKALSIKGLETLVFWGHGDAYRFCTKRANELAVLIKAWKKENSSLKTVELISCNVGHFDVAAMKDPNIGLPFIHQVKRELSSGFRSSTRDIAVKALPVNNMGALNAWSILLAEPQHSSWVYLTSKDATGTDESLMVAVNLFKYHTVSGKSVDYKGSLITKAQEIERNHQGRKFTMNYGTFGTLRSSLVTF